MSEVQLKAPQPGAIQSWMHDSGLT